MWLQKAIETMQKTSGHTPLSGLHGPVWVTPEQDIIASPPSHYRWVKANVNQLLQRLLPWQPPEENPETAGDYPAYDVYDRMMELGWIQVRVTNLGICINAHSPAHSMRTVKSFLQNFSMTLSSNQIDKTNVFLDFEQASQANTESNLNEWLWAEWLLLARNFFKNDFLARFKWFRLTRSVFSFDRNFFADFFPIQFIPNQKTVFLKGWGWDFPSRAIFFRNPPLRTFSWFSRIGPKGPKQDRRDSLTCEDFKKKFACGTCAHALDSAWCAHVGPLSLDSLMWPWRRCSCSAWFAFGSLRVPLPLNGKWPFSILDILWRNHASLGLLKFLGGWGSDIHLRDVFLYAVICCYMLCYVTLCYVTLCYPGLWVT